LAQKKANAIIGPKKKNIAFIGPERKIMPSAGA